jgi:hypothetical protein
MTTVIIARTMPHVEAHDNGNMIVPQFGQYASSVSADGCSVPCQPHTEQRYGNSRGVERSK